MCSRHSPSRALRGQRERGGVTIEFAIALIGLVAVLAAVLIGIAGMITTLRCVDAAHTVARMSALGYSTSELEAAAAKKMVTPARTAIRGDGNWIEVTVTAPVPNSPWNWEVSHSAHAFIEPHARQQ